MEYANNDDPISNAVNKLFGLSYLFPYQRLVVSNLLEAARAAGIAIHWPGRDSVVVEVQNDDEQGCEVHEDGASLGRQIVILPTGAGKSLCFQLPAMLLGASGPTLVIYPILSLMADQERRLTEKGFFPVLIRGGQSKKERDIIWKKILCGESKFIIANPEVLLTSQMQKRLPELGIIHTVIDEAHCVSEWGESFRPMYLEIYKIIKAAGSPLVTAFTATASEAVLKKINQYVFGDKGARCIVGNPDRINIEYHAQGCILRNLAVHDLLIAYPRPAIVFCSSRPGTERLAKYLRNCLTEKGISWANEIRFYHAGLSREEKKDVENWYFHNTDAVLVATCAYGLGVDKADIRTVIHRDCPPTVEAYLQESGRAGRDGKQSQAILLWGPDDKSQLGRAKTEQAQKRIEQLLGYAWNNTRCRREILLNLLDYEGNCSKPEEHCCDVCAGKSRAGLREENSIVDFFSRNRRSYTSNEAACTLSGLEVLSEEEAEEAISVLVKKGILVKCKNPFWKNKITVKTKKRSPR